MTSDHDLGFFVGELDSGKFAAASICAPFFCFVGDTEDDVVAKATKAIAFFCTDEGVRTVRKATSNRVVNFVPQRRVAVERERICA